MLAPRMLAPLYDGLDSLNSNCWGNVDINMETVDRTAHYTTQTQQSKAAVYIQIPRSREMSVIACYANNPLEIKGEARCGGERLHSARSIGEAERE